MPPRTKVATRTCREKVRTEGGNRVVCDVEFTGEKCPQPDPHILPFKTGFCASGWCEGTRAKTWRGDPAPTCEFWETCNCECHDMVSKMFAMSEMERIPVNNSAYVHEDGGFKRPSQDEIAREAAERRHRLDGAAPSAPVVIESPAPGVVPPLMARSFRPTATGRAARGELEAQVNRVCGVWIVEKYPWPCTPLWISETIAKDEGINPPSTGAITSCFNKWIELGFAVIRRKPLRFEHYTEEGIRLGLEAMKDAKRRKRDQARSELERGVRR